jgi:hypothetical protein
MENILTFVIKNQQAVCIMNLRLECKKITEVNRFVEIDDKYL